MGTVHSSSEQRRSRRRFTIAQSSIRSPNAKEPFLFATEPKHKSKDVQMYNMDYLNILKSNPKFVWVLETEALLTPQCTNSRDRCFSIECQSERELIFS